MILLINYVTNGRKEEDKKQLSNYIMPLCCYFLNFVNFSWQISGWLVPSQFLRKPTQTRWSPSGIDLQVTYIIRVLPDNDLAGYPANKFSGYRISGRITGYPAK